MNQCFYFSIRIRHTRSVSAFLLNRSSDLSSASVRTSVFPARTRKVNANNSAALTGRSTPLIMFSVNSAPSMMKIGRASCRERVENGIVQLEERDNTQKDKVEAIEREKDGSETGQR